MSRRVAQLDRLGQELLGSLLDGPHRQVYRAMGGEDDRGNGGIHGPQALEEDEAIAVGKLKVEDGGIRP